MKLYDANNHYGWTFVAEIGIVMVFLGLADAGWLCNVIWDAMNPSG
jgi:hypothetical protein